MSLSITSQDIYNSSQAVMQLESFANKINSLSKDSYALNFAYNAAVALMDQISDTVSNKVSGKGAKNKMPKSVGIFSLEMHAEQLSTKLMAMDGKIDSSKILSGRLNEAEYNTLRSAGNRLSQLPIFIDDTAALSISAIRTRARRLKRKHNLGILFIDLFAISTTIETSK